MNHLIALITGCWSSGRGNYSWKVGHCQLATSVLQCCLVLGRDSWWNHCVQQPVSERQTFLMLLQDSELHMDGVKECWTYILWFCRCPNCNSAALVYGLFIVFSIITCCTVKSNQKLSNHVKKSLNILQSTVSVWCLCLPLVILNKICKSHARCLGF